MGRNQRFFRLIYCDMASDPERPIEKLLRDCADQRRQKAGPPLELHPATRRLFQGEIERQFGRPTSQAFSARDWLRRFWPRVAFAVAGAAALVALIGVLVPTHPHPAERLAKNELSPAPAAEESAQQNLRRTAVMPQSTEQERAAPSQMLGTASARPPQAIAAQASANFESEAPTAPSALPPQAPGSVARENPLTLAAAAARPTGSLDTLSTEKALEQRTEVQGGNRGGLKTAVAFNFAEANKDLAARNAWNFIQTGPAARTVQAGKATSTVPLLATFEVQQSGPMLEIIDHDGSVYKGYWQNATTTDAINGTADGPRFAPALSAGATRQQSAAPANYSLAATPVPLPTVSNYFFRVTGTNLTLNRQVVFTGNFSVPASKAGQPFENSNQLQQKDAASLQNLQNSQLPLLNSRISGTALLDGQKLEINAVPEKPKQ